MNIKALILAITLVPGGVALAKQPDWVKNKNQTKPDTMTAEEKARWQAQWKAERDAEHAKKGREGEEWGRKEGQDRRNP